MNKASKTPWCDCKVAFSVDDADPFDHTILKPLPDGWSLDGIDGTGARWVAVFRVAGVPTVEDGRKVKRWLRSIGANK